MASGDRLHAPSYGEMDQKKKGRMVRRLKPQWIVGVADDLRPKAERKRLAGQLLMAQAQALNSANWLPAAEVFYNLAGNDPDVFVRLSGHGTEVVNEVIMTVAAAAFKLYRPLLLKHGFEDSLAGFARMDQMLADVSDTPELAEAMARNTFNLCFGHHDETSNYLQRLCRHVIWSAISMGIAPALCSHSSYLQHLVLKPMERRRRSLPRTVAWVEICVRWLSNSMLPHSMNRLATKRVVWILGATHEVEGKLAQEGYFEDSMAMLDGSMVICLVGEQKLPGRWPAGSMAKVTSHTYDEAAQQDLLPQPFMVCLFNSGLGTLGKELLERWLPILMGIATGISPLLVTAARSEEECRGEAAVIHSLGGQTIVFCLRNLYSGTAANPDANYDEAGWLNIFSTSPCAGRPLKLHVLTDILLEKGFVDKVMPKKNRRPAAVHAHEEEQPTSSASGGSSASNAGHELKSSDGAGSSRSAAVFWGILDLKYDPTAGPAERVRVLETGDGRASRFSGYGAAIKEAFQQESKLEDSIRVDVLTDNKKLTHDTIVDLDYAHLRPRQLAFRREYVPGLAETICCALCLDWADKSAVVVLKLCNRARGAGVVPIACENLDSALQVLLQPPEDLDEFLRKQPRDWPYRVKWGCFEEQARHWWCNECPIFLVEELCRSAATAIGDKQYDGTMRVSFSLHRQLRDRLPAGWVMSPDGPVCVGGRSSGPDGHGANGNGEAKQRPAPRPWDDDRPYLELFRPDATFLRLQWLGGYWKLPIGDAGSSDLRDKIVSVAKQGTAPVEAAQLHDVYACLGDMVSVLFNPSNHSNMSHTGLTKRYSGMPELGAYMASRLSISIRMRDPHRSLQILQLAQQQNDRIAVPTQAFVSSHILRNLAVHEALHRRWARAAEGFKKALEEMPTNAAARYLLGMAHLELGEPARAVALLEQALHLDPDLKAIYVNLAVARLRLGHYEEAAEASLAGLKRHPQTSHCLYNLGVARFAGAQIAASHLPQAAMATIGGGPASREAESLGFARFKVVHDRVMVRDKPSTTEEIIRVVKCGTEVEGIVSSVIGTPWLQLGEEACDRLVIDHGWMLIDGQSMGLGQLLAPLDGPEDAPAMEPAEPKQAERNTDKVLAQKAEALQALVAARDCRGKEMPWTEADERMVLALESEGFPRWPLPELPRDGWRFHTWRS